MFCKLEHQLLQFYKNENLPPLSEACLTSDSTDYFTVYLAVSGGLDSMAMLVLHQAVSKALKIKLVVVHVHHGGSLKNSSSEQDTFRDHAYFLVKKYCDSYKIKFISNILNKYEVVGVLSQKNNLNLETSEEFYRNYRYNYFSKLFVSLKLNSSLLVTAHTANDLLETRLMRLMRGVGSQGFFAIKAVKDKGPYFLIRPLLNVMRADLETYIKNKKTPFCTDPSNQDTRFLRNWLRLKVLPVIKKKDAAYLYNMSQSCKLIADRLQDTSSFLSKVIVQNKINLCVFYTLALSEQRQTLAHYLYSNKVNNYSMSHILEILKYLNRPEKEQNFKLAQNEWILTQGSLYILDNSTKSTKIKAD